RRGVAAERCALLPIILPKIARSMERAAAKRELGLSPERIMLLTIARPHKYLPFRGASYIESLLPVIEAEPRVVFIAIGPQQDGPWHAAAERTGGRVQALGVRDDTDTFYEAADIYVDSYPLISITSLLEAGSYATSLVSRNPHGGAVSVLCADNPALDGQLLMNHDLELYQQTLSGLINDPASREQLGARTTQAIQAVHHGHAWRNSLAALYAIALQVAPVEVSNIHIDQPCISAVDLLLPLLYNNEPEIEQIMQFHLRALPFTTRLREWIRASTGAQCMRPGLLLPEWLGARIERRLYPDGSDHYAALRM
ncbi:MAG: hypothetical protein MI924_11120, partial [Chloroflexales bacterium]|nr:hypothetical protein [Chloroflexales bacterium]